MAIWAFVVRPLVLWWLSNCTWPLAALSFVYVVRSLNLLLFPAIAVDVSPTTNVVCGVLGAGLIVWSFVWTPATNTRRPSLARMRET